MSIFYESAADQLRRRLELCMKVDGIRQKDLARAADIHDSQLCSFIKGTRASMSVEVAERLVEVMDRVAVYEALDYLPPELRDRLRDVALAMLIPFKIEDIISRALTIFFALLREAPDILPGYDPRRDRDNKGAWKKRIAGISVGGDLLTKQKEALADLDQLEALLKEKRDKRTTPRGRPKSTLAQMGSEPRTATQEEPT